MTVRAAEAGAGVALAGAGRREDSVPASFTMAIISSYSSGGSTRTRVIITPSAADQSLGSPRSMGGWIRSTIPKQHLPRLSDRHWLGIVTGRWRDRPRRWRQMAPDELGEATATALPLTWVR
jgi:hypothetical protein